MLVNVEVKDLIIEIMGLVIRGFFFFQDEILGNSIDIYFGSIRYIMMIFMQIEQEVILWSFLGVSGMEVMVIIKRISGIGIQVFKILVYMF